MLGHLKESCNENKEFLRKTKFYQIAEGYCYNSDSLFLWDFILPHLLNRARVLELGSGSGIIGLLCTRERNISLYQIEKQREYVFLNAKNALINGLSTHIFHGDCRAIFNSKDICDSLYGSYFFGSRDPRNIEASHKNSNIATKDENIKIALQSFDLIITNPPFYVNKTLPSQNSFKEQATQNIHLPLETMISGAKKLLKSNGKFIFCYAPSMIPKILTLLEQNKFSVEKIRFVHPRIEKHATLVMICARRNANTQTHILPPIITHNGSNQQDNTREVLDIYKRANTQSIKVNCGDILWHEILIST